MTEVAVVAIDGPSGVGKGTVARAVATRLGFTLLDSGAIYRLLALAAEREGLGAGDVDALVALADGLDVAFAPGDDHQPLHAILAGEDVDGAIRSEACGQAASLLAAIGPVRAALLARQRAFRRTPGLVADGRDMGTIVFPDAAAKIFLTASVDERARRRHKQLIEKGISVSLPDLFEEIGARDRRDKDRVVAPLRPAEDAVLIDTTAISVDEVLARVMEVLAGAGITARPG